MKCKIHAITPSGCVLPVYEKDGTLMGDSPIETGDFETAEKILTPEAYTMVLKEWTPEKIATRKSEREYRAKMQIDMSAH